ncbi:MAG: pimeloyl-ACP methyl ester carboxylesterase [Planctomycetota bacterium]|jgi:pimeloyl-ACP methyl ester carboxylesterase
MTTMISNLLALRCLFAVAALACAAANLAAQTDAPAKVSKDPVAGRWQGALKVSGQKLELGLHVKFDGKSYVATFDSITQNTNGIPVLSFTRKGDQIVADIKAIGSTYAATLRGTGAARELVGTWSQGGMELPLTMKIVDKIKEPNRPQNPKAPFPYEAVEVEFVSNEQVTLAGTLTLPPGDGPHPVAVMITGSGPQDRDESVAGHKPFLVIADHLTRQGLAVLRYDDRGVGKSTGDFTDATTADFASDVRAAIRFLQSRQDIDHQRIGIIGHSEGGLIAPIVASGPAGNAVAFSILLAPPTVNIADIIEHQSRLIGSAAGANPDVDVNADFIRDAFAAIIKHQDVAARTKAIEAVAKEAWPRFSEEARKSLGDSSQDLADEAEELQGPWLLYLLGHDPQIALKSMHGEVLALFGGKDLQVDPAQNMQPLKSVFAERSPKPTVVTLPNHNHLFQRCKTGSPTEYGEIEETISPEALDVMSKWLKRVVIKP